MAGINHFRFGRLVAEALTAEAFKDSGHRIVDLEVIPSFDGSSDEMCSWLIFSTVEEAQAAREEAPALEERARAVLAQRGYPTEALPSFRLSFTSVPEIEAGGGRFYYFR
ncbi:hypothetical protein ACIBEF_09175 [Micromonospora sp. NPDC050795]|uniref:hypothetical protein n=1 Tax=Micromonospora sp. NPDC050795 TaxID=3364282 RepID=UPI003793FD3A